MEEYEIALEDLKDELTNIRYKLEDILRDLVISYDKAIKGEIDSIDCIIFDIDQELANLENEAAHQNFLEYYGVSNTNELTKKQYAEALKKIDRN